MRNFFKDLWDLQKQSIGFIKKHPVGATLWIAVPSAIAMGGYSIWWYFDEIKEFIKKIFKPKKKEDKESV